MPERRSGSWLESWSKEIVSPDTRIGMRTSDRPGQLFTVEFGILA